MTLNDAKGIAVCHNHPAGSYLPSTADENFTKNLREASTFLDVNFVDSLIVNTQNLYSISNQDILQIQPQIPQVAEAQSALDFDDNFLYENQKAKLTAAAAPIMKITGTHQAKTYIKNELTDSTGDLTVFLNARNEVLGTSLQDEPREIVKKALMLNANNFLLGGIASENSNNNEAIEAAGELFDIQTLDTITFDVTTNETFSARESEGVMEAGENYDIKKDDLETKPSRSEETNWSTEFLSSETKGGLIPDSAKTESLDASVTSAPTLSPHLPQFTMTGEYLSNVKQGYKVAETSDIRFLNQYLSTIQEAAQFYDEKMKDEIYHYVTLNDVGNYEVVPVRYGADNFAHLTGISFVDDNRELSAKAVLKSFVDGNFEHQSILVAEQQNFEKKIKVLEQLKDLSNLESLYMKDFSQVKSNVKFDDAFKTQSDDLMLAMRDFGNDFLTPYSLMNTQKDKAKQKYQKVGELRPIVAIFDEERTQSGSSIGVIDYDRTVFENIGDFMHLQQLMLDIIVTTDRSNEKLAEMPRNMQRILDELEVDKSHELTWQEIHDNGPGWLENAYEMSDISDGYPAKTVASDWSVFSDDFDLKPDSILTDAQKIEIQTRRAFYDEDNEFHSFKEVLEVLGLSIPENIPEVYDDRPTFEEEAKWLLNSQEGIKKQIENEAKEMALENQEYTEIAQIEAVDKEAQFEIAQEQTYQNISDALETFEADILKGTPEEIYRQADKIDFVKTALDELRVRVDSLEYQENPAKYSFSDKYLAALITKTQAEGTLNPKLYIEASTHYQLNSDHYEFGSGDFEHFLEDYIWDHFELEEILSSFEATQIVETVLGEKQGITEQEADRAFEDERVREAVRSDVPAFKEAEKEETLQVIPDPKAALEYFSNPDTNFMSRSFDAGNIYHLTLFLYDNNKNTSIPWEFRLSQDVDDQTNEVVLGYGSDFLLEFEPQLLITFDDLNEALASSGYNLAKLEKDYHLPDLSVVDFAIRDYLDEVVQKKVFSVNTNINTNTSVNTKDDDYEMDM